MPTRQIDSSAARRLRQVRRARGATAVAALLYRFVCPAMMFRVLVAGARGLQNRSACCLPADALSPKGPSAAAHGSHETVPSIIPPIHGRGGLASDVWRKGRGAIGQPGQKAYKDFDDGWPLNSWPITENSNGYQTAYIRPLSRHVK